MVVIFLNDPTNSSNMLVSEHHEGDEAHFSVVSAKP